MSILPNTRGGYLELIIGPMFSGKTSRLLEIHKKCKISNIECVIINHSSDNRYSNNATVLSHSKEKAPCILLDNLYSIGKSNLMSNSFAPSYNRDRWVSKCKNFPL